MKNRTYNSKLKVLSRVLRKCQTDAEGLLWSKLKNRQLEDCKFRRQMPIGHYIVDFYCHNKNLAIELDGGQHSEQKAEDNIKDEFLQSRGITVIRFWNNVIFENMEGVLLEILKHLT